MHQTVQAASLAGDVVSSQVPLQEVPRDGVVLALPPQLVDVAAEGGAWFVLVLLLHVIYVPVVPLPVPLPEPFWASSAPCLFLAKKKERGG